MRLRAPASLCQPLSRLTYSSSLSSASNTPLPTRALLVPPPPLPQSLVHSRRQPRQQQRRQFSASHLRDFNSSQILRTGSVMAPTIDTRPVIISGPSGAGKSTILKRLFEEFPDRFGFSVSHTTRSPRPGEQNGREYHFTDHPTFEGMIAQDAFVENAVFGGNRYGTSFQAVKDVAAQGRVCILDIEMEGVKQVDRLAREGRLPFDRPKFLFLAPPSVEVLEQRLRGRGTDTEDAIRKRLDQAKVELEFAATGGIHEKVVVNDDLDKAYKEVREFIVPASES